MIIELNIGLDLPSGPDTPTDRMLRAIKAARTLTDYFGVFRRIRSYTVGSTLVVRTESDRDFDAWVRPVLRETARRLGVAIVALVDGEREHAFGELDGRDFPEFIRYRPADVARADFSHQRTLRKTA